MEWTPVRIRRLREVGLCLSQDDFDRFLAALVSSQTATQAIPAFRDRGHRLAPTLDGLRGAVLDWPLTVRMDMSENSAYEMGETTACIEATTMTDIAQVHRRRRSRVHLDLSWAAANQAEDALAVLHLLAAERVAEQTVSRNASTRELLSTLVERERRGATPGMRGLAARAGLLQ